MHDDAWKCTALAVWYNGYLYPEILGTMAEGLTGWMGGVGTHHRTPYLKTFLMRLINLTFQISIIWTIGFEATPPGCGLYKYLYFSKLCYLDTQAIQWL